MSERADAEDAPDGPAHEYKTVFDGRIEKTKEYMRSLHQRFDSVGWESDTMMPVIPWLGLVSDGSVYVVFAQSIKQRRVSRNGITNIDRDAIVTADGVELRVVCPMLLHADTAAALQSFYDSVIRVNTRDWLLLCSRPRVMDQQDNLGLTIIPASDVTKVVLVEHQTIRTPEMQAKFGTRSPQPGCTDFLEALINGKAAQFIALTKVHAFEHLKKAIIKQEKEVEKTAAASAAASTTAAGAAAAAAAATAQGLKNTAMPPPPKPDSLQSLAPPPPGGFPVGVSCWHHAIGRRRTSAVIMERSHDGTRYRVQISNRETWHMGPDDNAGVEAASTASYAFDARAAATTSVATTSAVTGAASVAARGVAAPVVAAPSVAAPPNMATVTAPVATAAIPMATAAAVMATAAAAITLASVAALAAMATATIMATTVAAVVATATAVVATANNYTSFRGGNEAQHCWHESRAGRGARPFTSRKSCPRDCHA